MSTHIYSYAPPGKRQHIETPDCWCRPVCVQASFADAVWSHTGQVRPSVSESIKAERRTPFDRTLTRARNSLSGVRNPT